MATNMHAACDSGDKLAPLRPSNGAVRLLTPKPACESELDTERSKPVEIEVVGSLF